MLIKYYTFTATKKVIKIFRYLNLYAHGMTVRVIFNEYYFKIVFFPSRRSKCLKK